MNLYYSFNFLNSEFKLDVESILLYFIESLKISSENLRRQIPSPQECSKFIPHLIFFVIII